MPFLGVCESYVRVCIRRDSYLTNRMSGEVSPADYGMRRRCYLIIGCEEWV